VVPTSTPVPAFSSGPGAVLPPEVYQNSTATPGRVRFLRGYAATRGLPLLCSAQDGRAQLLQVSAST
jgi:hypothetical protein